MGVRKIIASTAGLAVMTILFVVGVVQVVQTRIAHAQVILPPSVLCFPDTCNSNYDDNSIQDVELKRSIFRHYVVDNRSSKNMKRINLEIAKLKIHHMQAVTVGVYATTDVQSTGADLNITRDETKALCAVDNSVRSKSDLVVVTVTSATSSRTELVISGTELCNKFGSGDPGVTVHLLPSDFDLNAGLQLFETKVTFGYNDAYYDTLDPTYEELGSVGFKFNLVNCSAPAGCRRYVGLIKADTQEADEEGLNAARNLALEGDTSNNYSSDNGSDNIRIGGTQLYTREYFEFGLECAYNAPEVKYVDIYDLNDNDFVSSERNLIGAVIQKYVVNNVTKVGRWEVIPRSDVTVVNDKKGSASGKIVSLDSGVRGLDSRNPRLYELSDGDWVFIPDNGNRKVAQLKYTMQPKTRYRMMILPNGYTNFIGVGVPGDAIYGMIGCDNPPVVPVPPTAACLPDSNFSGLTLNTPGAFKPIIKLYGFPLNPPLTFQYSIRKQGDPVTFAPVAATFSTVAPGEQHMTPTAPLNYTATSMGSYIMEWRAVQADGTVVWNCDHLTTVGYQPYFTVEGGDILGGFSPDTAYSIIASWNSNNTPVGSYIGASGTHAAIALGNITSFVTSANTDGGKSRLAFANTTSNGAEKYGGGFTTTLTMPDYWEQANGTEQVCSSTVLAVASLDTGVYDCTGDITINGGMLAAGKNVTIRTTGNVFISSDITYAPYTMTNIPRLNVYTKGGNIVVSSAVTELHGVFVAQVNASGSKFYSCGDSVTKVAYGYTNNAEQCRNLPLTVYGSVVAEEIVLGRTIGSWTDPTPQAAERFVYGPETWLSRPENYSATERKGPFDSYISLPPVL